MILYKVMFLINFFLYHLLMSIFFLRGLTYFIYVKTAYLGGLLKFLLLHEYAT